MTIENLATLFEQAMSYHEQGDLVTAKNIYAKILEQNPQHTDALHQQGLIAIEDGDVANAIFYFKQACESDPHSALSHFNLANALKVNRRYEEALYHFEQAATLNMQHAPTHQQLGVLYYYYEHYDDAITHYQLALRINSKHVQTHYNIALCYLKLQELDSAITHLKQVILLNPKHSAAHHQLGNLFFKEQKYEQAVTAYKASLQQDTTNFDVVYNLACCLLKQGDYANAELYFQHAIQLQPEDPDAYYNLGIINMRLGLLAAAKEFFYQTLNFDSKYAAAHTNLGNIFLREQNDSQALHHYQQNLLIQPNNIAIAHTVDALSGQTNPAKAPTEYVSTLFDNYAAYYDDHLTQQLNYQLPIILRETLAQYFSTLNLRIFDLGCGTGLCGVELHRFADKLYGADLSFAMLQKAKDKNIYDQLIHADFEIALQNFKEPLDCIVAADAFVYTGDLHNIFKLVKLLLPPTGIFIFSLEMGTHDSNYLLSKTGRYSHNQQYITDLIETYAYSLLAHDTIILRYQFGTPVYGNLFVIRRN